jgi:hypothetical protein
MKFLLIALLTIMILVIFSIMIVAQPFLPDFPSDPAAAPIDGGLGLLAAAGGAYALKKLRDKNKEGDME